MKRSSSNLAIFDLDHTLVSVDCEALWCEYLYKRKVVNKDFLEQILEYYKDYQNGRLNIFEYQALINKPLVENPQAEMLELRRKYLHQVKRSVRQKMLKRVKHFQKNGFTVILMTATNSFLAEAIGSKLNIHNIICTRLKIVNEQYVNEIDGTPAFRDGKVELLEQWLKDREITPQETWGYSDSHNDLPMLNWVQNPVVVSPDSILRHHATLNSWLIID